LALSLSVLYKVDHFSLYLSHLSFSFLSLQPAAQVFIYIGHSHEHKEHHLEWYDMDSNQANEQDQFSTMEIHHAYEINGHQVIGIIDFHEE